MAHRCHSADSIKTKKARASSKFLSPGYLCSRNVTLSVKVSNKLYNANIFCAQNYHFWSSSQSHPIYVVRFKHCIMASSAPKRVEGINSLSSCASSRPFFLAGFRYGLIYVRNCVHIFIYLGCLILTYHADINLIFMLE
jgi:hypothetical protein